MAIDVGLLGKFLNDQLKAYNSEYYDIPEDELWGALGLYVPSIGDLPFGAKEIQSFRKTTIGEGAVSDGRAYDIPMVDFGIEANGVKTNLVLASAEWSLDQLAEAQFAVSSGRGASFNLIEAKADAVKTAIERRIHRLVYAGMPETGFGGLFNSGSLTPVDATGDGNLYGSTTPLTPSALTSWFQGIIATFKTSSKLAYSSIIAYVDDSLFTALCAPIADNTGDTPYMRLTSQERGRFIKDIIPITELDPVTLAANGIISNAATRGRMILGDFGNPKSVKRQFRATDRTQPFMKDTGFHWGITGWAATSEVNFLVPERFEYVNFAHS